MKFLIVLVAAAAVLEDAAGVAEGETGAVLESLPFRQDYWTEAERLWETAKVEDFVNGTATSRRRRSTRSTPESEVFTDYANIFEFYSEILDKRHNITKRQAAGTATPAQCPNPTPSCTVVAGKERFRSQDGTCNNLINNSGWGAANRAFNRILPNAYSDNFNEPRGRFSSILPNPRLISVTVHPDNPNLVSQQITNMVPQFGQFLDHDITLTPDAGSQCCANPNSNPANCWAIPVRNDAFYTPKSQTCIDFTRSTPCVRSGIREQMNGNTAYIDGSQIYGSNTQRTMSLRDTTTRGSLRTNPNFQGFLPLGQSLGIQAQGSFVAGDDRINEMPGLAVMHNVWLMEHNRIATFFRANRAWDDERVFQETRRIIGALLQQVTYNEYLPIILGTDAMRNFNLGVGTWSTYNPNVDATIQNQFATASYRFGHSLISGIVRLISANNAEVGSYNISNEYFKSGQITQQNGQGYDLILRGLMRQNAPPLDHFVTTGVTNFLFRADANNFGSDLVARNIQRGRDHGLRSYNDYRTQVCNLPSLPSSFATLPAGINSDGWAKASRVYGSPLDIDLFVGGLIELPVTGGLSGPTFTCLKAGQFRALKFGDRFFFTHDLQTGFTPNQLDDITQQRLGDIICRNSQQPDTQQNVFLVPSSSNPTISCASRRTLNLNLY